MISIPKVNNAMNNSDNQNFFRKKSTIVIILSHFVMVLVFAFTRLVDADEGFYLIAAQEVWNGRFLYTDFFFPQMPYLPYFFSPISGHGFTTLFIARVLGCFASLLTVILFTRIVCKITVNNAVRTSLLFLYALNALIITWHPLAKTYMFTDFFLLFSFLSFLYFLKTRSINMIIAMAIAVGLAVNFRSVFAPIIACYAVVIFMNSAKSKFKNISIYFLTILFVSIPTLYLFYLSPDHFIYDNIGFHLMRNDWVSFSDGMIDRIKTFAKLLITPQIIVIQVVLLILYRHARNIKKIIKLSWYQSPTKYAGIFAVIITMIYLLPKPILQQYFLQTIPFVLIASTKGLEYFFSESKMKFWKLSRLSITKVLALIYILGILPYIVIFVFSVREQDGSNNLNNMNQMCSYIHEQSEKKLIMSEWPAIPLLAKVSNLEGLEFLGFEFPLPLTIKESRNYNLALDNDIRDDIIELEPDFIVVKYDPALPLRPIIKEQYYPDTSFGTFNLFKKK